MDRRQQEQRLLFLEELRSRRENDPLRTFELFPKQKEFVKSVLNKEKKENYYMGANRSGKSDAGAYIGAHLARFGYPDAPRHVGAKGSTITVGDRATSGWVSALDFPTSRDTIQPKYFDNGFVPPGATHQPFIPAREIQEWRVSDQILKLKNGSIIGFKSADSGRSKYQGAEKDWIHFDEEHPEGIYEESIIRVGAKPLNIFTTCTLLPPEGAVGGISWVYSRIVKPWKEKKRPDIGIFNASIYDNPHIPREEIAYLESKWPEGSLQRRIRLNGELVGGFAGARIYSAFDYQLNVRPQGEIALRRPLAWVWDFNVEPMVSLIGQRERSLFRVFHELILQEGNIQEMCDLFKQIHPYHLAEIWLYGDASGRDRSHQTKFSSYQLIMNSMIDYPAPLRMKVPERNPSISDRVNAMNRALRNERGEVNLEISPVCTELADDFDQVITDGKGGIKKTFNRKDPYYRRTHTSDAVGYWIFQEAPVRALSHEYERPRINLKPPSYAQVAARPLLH